VNGPYDTNKVNTQLSSYTATSMGYHQGDYCGVAIVDHSCYKEWLAVIVGDDNPNTSTAKTGEYIAKMILGSVQNTGTYPTVKYNSEVWHQDILDRIDEEPDRIQLLSAASSAVSFENATTAGVAVSWTPYPNTNHYLVRVYDNTLSTDVGLYTVPADETSITIRELLFGSANNGYFQGGHEYTIRVGAYNSADRRISNELKQTVGVENRVIIKPDCDIAILMDTSSSISYLAFSEMQTTAKAFADAVLGSTSKNVQIAVIPFGGTCGIKRLNPVDTGFYTSVADVKLAVNQVSMTGGLTRLADALLLAEKEMELRDATQKIILVMSDGKVNDASAEASVFGLSGLYDPKANAAYNLCGHLEEEGYEIHTMGFRLFDTKGAEQMLVDIANMTGGTYQEVIGAKANLTFAAKLVK